MPDQSPTLARSLLHLESSSEHILAHTGRQNSSVRVHCCELEGRDLSSHVSPWLNHVCLYPQLTDLLGVPFLRYASYAHPDPGISITQLHKEGSRGNNTIRSTSPLG